MFCPGCPHKGREGKILDCLSDPRKKFEPSLKILRKMASYDPGLGKLKIKREEAAKALGITAQPLPDVKAFTPKQNKDGGGLRGQFRSHRVSSSPWDPISKPCRVGKHNPIKSVGPMQF